MRIFSLLSHSAATAAFRADLEAFAQDGLPKPRLQFGPYLPPVKVLRLLTKLLEEKPSFALQSVEIQGHSGCSDFRGEMRVRSVQGEETCITFRWDCRWKAMQMGWQDAFGLPDQIRAAREFDHDCFQTWQDRPVLLAPA